MTMLVTDDTSSNCNLHAVRVVRRWCDAPTHLTDFTITAGHSTTVRLGTGVLGWLDIRNRSHHVSLVGSLNEKASSSAQKSSKKDGQTFEFLHVTIQLVLTSSLQAKPEMQVHIRRNIIWQKSGNQPESCRIGEQRRSFTSTLEDTAEYCRRIVGDSISGIKEHLSAEVVDEEVDIGSAWAMRKLHASFEESPMESYETVADILRQLKHLWCAATP